MKEKIREYAIPQAINLYDSLLSKLENTDIEHFIYSKQRASCLYKQNKHFVASSQQAAVSPSLILQQPNKSIKVADDLSSVPNPLPIDVINSVCSNKVVETVPSCVDLVSFFGRKDINHNLIGKNDFLRHTLDGIPAITTGLRANGEPIWYLPRTAS
jgi:hypothetical protein